MDRCCGWDVDRYAGEAGVHEAGASRVEGIVWWCTLGGCDAGGFSRCQAKGGANVHGCGGGGQCGTIWVQFNVRGCGWFSIWWEVNQGGIDSNDPLEWDTMAASVMLSLSCSMTVGVVGMGSMGVRLVGAIVVSITSAGFGATLLGLMLMRAGAVRVGSSAMWPASMVMVNMAVGSAAMLRQSSSMGSGAVEVGFAGMRLAGMSLMNMRPMGFSIV